MDWRGSRYAQDPEENMFSHCFANTRELAGVPLEVPTADCSQPLPGPAFPDHWNRDDLLSAPWRGPGEDSFEYRDQAVALIRSGADIAASTVVLNTCVNDGVSRFADARRCLEALRPKPHIATVVDEFHHRMFSRQPVIGLHIRHGNGGNIQAHGRYWVFFDQAIERCRKAVAMARSRIAAETPVFLCTDSIEVLTAITEVVPNVMTRTKAFRRPGQGELHHGEVAYAGRDDALAEMLLLARCDVLIRYPPASFFSFPAAVLKPSAALPAELVGSLAAPFDHEDPLSCAVLF